MDEEKNQLDVYRRKEYHMQRKKKMYTYECMCKTTNTPKIDQY